MTNPPPYIAGQDAFKADKPLSDNPHDPDVTFGPDDWPGAHVNWSDGWKHAYRIAIHTKKQEKTHG